MPSFDPATFKAQQKDNWNNLSPAWDRWYELFESGAAPASATLLADSGIAEGQRILDIGSGTGQPALDAAAIVGPKGTVVSVDQAGEMLEVARRRAAELGLDNVEFVQQDAERIDFDDASFDSVISRFTLMFLPDLDAVLRTAHRLLRPGGRLAASVWSVPPRVPILSLAFGLVAARLQLADPPPGLPGPFSLADAEALVERLRKAGFAEASYVELTLRFPVASVDEFATFSWELLPGWLRTRLRDETGDVRDPETWQAFLAAAREYETEDGGGLLVPAVSYCVTAVKVG